MALFAICDNIVIFPTGTNDNLEMPVFFFNLSTSSIWHYWVIRALLIAFASHTMLVDNRKATTERVSKGSKILLKIRFLVCRLTYLSDKNEHKLNDILWRDLESEPLLWISFSFSCARWAGPASFNFTHKIINFNGFPIASVTSDFSNLF